MKYCAFLRGVNVNGTTMKMAEVCKVFSDAGMHQVSSVLASGNIIFSSDKPPADLKLILEKAMAEHFMYEAFLFLKDEMEVREMWENNPFGTTVENHVYVFVGLVDVDKTLMEAFGNADKTDGELAKTVGNTFYWQVAKGNTLGSSFGKILGRKSLKDKMTSRNINTIDKILKKL